VPWAEVPTEKLLDTLGLVSRQQHSLGVVGGIEIALVAAAILAILFYRFKQPALLAYIVAGLLLSLFTRPLVGSSLPAIEHISHLGLVFLLFIIGLELDLKNILRLGRRSAAAVLLQAPIAIALIWLVQWGFSLLDMRVPGLGSTPRSFFFFAVAVALSSTAVVVKLLGDKFDLYSQAGKVTVLTLIAQDIWAVLALSYVSSHRDDSGTGWGTIATMAAGALIMAVLMSLVARYFIARVMIVLGQAPDLMSLASLAWCFAGSAAFSAVGLSAEMGALIAGLTLGTLPAAGEILVKVSSLRDFFMALFFIALGMSLPPPTWPVLGASLGVVLVTLLSRLLFFAPSLLTAGMGPVVSIASAINLSQLSEFSLLLVPVGIASKALTAEQGSIISYGMMLSVLLSTYGIKYNYVIALWVERVLHLSSEALGSLRAPAVDQTEDQQERGADIVLLGYYTNAEELIQHIKREKPELIGKILVIDYNLKNHSAIKAHGLRVVYGDISNLDTLRRYRIDRAAIVISTIDDTFLHGTNNKALLTQVKANNPSAHFIATAADTPAAVELVRRGAVACVCPPTEAAAAYFSCIEGAIEERLASAKTKRLSKKQFS
jgi:Kef-type K+ transport system membrane component KefB